MLSAILVTEAVLLFGGTVHTLTPDAVPQIADVLVEDGRITAIGTDLEAPPGAERFDCTGRHLIPGLVDTYVSFDPDHDALYVSAGVTCVRDAGGEQVRLLAERMPAARERTPGPALVTAAAVLDGDPPSTPNAGIVRNADQATNVVPLVAENGADFLSIQQRLNADAYAKILEIGHERGLWVWGPRPFSVSLEEALELGQDGFFGLDSLLPHGTSWGEREGFDAELDAIATLAGAAQVGVVPLLAASALRIEPVGDDALARLTELDEDYEVWWRGEWEARRTLLEDERVLEAARSAIARQVSFTRTLLAAGADVVPGSGAPNPWLFPGAALHDELARWIAAGVPIETVLKRATLDSARVVGQETERGQLTVGRIADVLVVDSDPRESLEGLRRPHAVCLRGQLLPRLLLDDLVETARVESGLRREAKSRTLVVEPPELPEGAVVLSGRVHTIALERTVTVERFAVVRAADGSTHLVGRVVYPDEDGLTRKLEVSQTIDTTGRIVKFEVKLYSGEDILFAEGQIVAGSLRVRRRLNELPIKIDGTQEQVRLLDVGSVTTLLALGQREPSAGFPVMTFGETLEPLVVNWSLDRDARGVWQVATHRGRLAFQLDEHGAPTQLDVQEGRVLRTTLLDEVDAFGGAGYPPLPAPVVEASAETEAPEEDLPPEETPPEDPR